MMEYISGVEPKPQDYEVVAAAIDHMHILGSTHCQNTAPGLLDLGIAEGFP